jgi:uncharacterized protein
MPITINLRHLEAHEARLDGELPAEELDLGLRDEIIKAEKPLKYGIEVQKLDGGLLLNGRLELVLRCQCVRCLKPFEYNVILSPWTRHLALAGEESVVVSNDCVDLTPYVREDILLEFPQHPVCEAECSGLPRNESGRAKTSKTAQTRQGSSAWAELDKLNL